MVTRLFILLWRDIIYIYNGGLMLRSIWTMFGKLTKLITPKALNFFNSQWRFGQWSSFIWVADQTNWKRRQGVRSSNLLPKKQGWTFLYVLLVDFALYQAIDYFLGVDLAILYATFVWLGGLSLSKCHVLLLKRTLLSSLLVDFLLSFPSSIMCLNGWKRSTKLLTSTELW